MAAIAQQNGADGWADAYFAFAERYFDRLSPSTTISLLTS